MTEKEFMDADYEVISMVNKGRNSDKAGGELPGKVVRFIPDERADTVLALDERIQKLREAMPIIATGAVALAFLIGLVL